MKHSWPTYSIIDHYETSFIFHANNTVLKKGEKKCLILYPGNERVLGDLTNWKRLSQTQPKLSALISQREPPGLRFWQVEISVRKLCVCSASRFSWNQRRIKSVTVNPTNGYFCCQCTVCFHISLRRLLLFYRSRPVAFEPKLKTALYLITQLLLGL